MNAKRVTINDVAAAAGVSRQTVTRAMNEMSRISPETRDRVLRIAEELDYRPSRFASNLARQKHHTVALVVPSLRNPYYTDLAADLIEIAAERSWETVVASTEHSTGTDVVARLASQIDAIVGYFPVEDEAELVRVSRSVPLVLIERPATVNQIWTVTLDFRRGMQELISQLRQRGSASFAMIDTHHPGTQYVPSVRRQYFEEFAAEDAAIVVTAAESFSASGVALNRIIDAHPEVDTVIAFNDVMAMGAIQGAYARGIRVPEELRVVGIDGLSLGETMLPPLSTLSIDRYSVARAAMDMVIDATENIPGAPRRRFVLPRPIWRESA